MKRIVLQGNEGARGPLLMGNGIETSSPPPGATIVKRIINKRLGRKLLWRF